jgi:hypothetical protein
MCVHFALNATAVFAVGRATMAGSPSGRFTGVDIPTWISASFASGGLAAEVAVEAAEEEGLDAGLVVGGVELGAGLLGVESDALLDEPELQAANTAAPAPAAPAASTERRVTVESTRIKKPSGVNAGALRTDTGGLPHRFT